MTCAVAVVSGTGTEGNPSSPPRDVQLGHAEKELRSFLMDKGLGWDQDTSKDKEKGLYQDYDKDWGIVNDWDDSYGNGVSVFTTLPTFRAGEEDNNFNHSANGTNGVNGINNDKDDPYYAEWERNNSYEYFADDPVKSDRAQSNDPVKSDRAQSNNTYYPSEDTFSYTLQIPPHNDDVDDDDYTVDGSMVMVVDDGALVDNLTLDETPEKNTTLPSIPTGLNSNSVLPYLPYYDYDYYNGVPYYLSGESPNAYYSYWGGEDEWTTEGGFAYYSYSYSYSYSYNYYYNNNDEEWWYNDDGYYGVGYDSVDRSVEGGAASSITKATDASNTTAIAATTTSIPIPITTTSSTPSTTPTTTTVSSSSSSSTTTTSASNSIPTTDELSLPFLPLYDDYGYPNNNIDPTAPFMVISATETSSSSSSSVLPSVSLSSSLPSPSSSS